MIVQTDVTGPWIAYVRSPAGYREVLSGAGPLDEDIPGVLADDESVMVIPAPAPE